MTQAIGQHLHRRLSGKSFQDLTNTPSMFYGTTNEVELADLKKRTRIIWPHKINEGKAVGP